VKVKSVGMERISTAASIAVSDATEMTRAYAAWDNARDQRVPTYLDIGVDPTSRKHKGIVEASTISLKPSLDQLQHYQHRYSRLCHGEGAE
jgi:hypothetical protein